MQKIWLQRPAAIKIPYNQTYICVILFLCLNKARWMCFVCTECDFMCTWMIVGVSLIGCTSEKKVEIHQMFCSWVDLVVKI